MNLTRKNVLIAGGSGLIGRALTSYLSLNGYNVSILSRKKDSKRNAFYWDPESSLIDMKSITDQDFIINLAGASIADKYWTKKQKKILIESRVKSTRLLAESIKNSATRPLKIIQASAVGYYGHRPKVLLTENSEAGKGFLCDLCRDWEKSARLFSEAGIPLSIVRIGIVLSNEGGYLPKMKKILQYGVNPVFGNGRQIVPWVHINDLIKIFGFILTSDKNSGVYNAVSPNPVTTLDLQRSIVHPRKALTLKTSSWLTKKLLGDFSEVFLNDQSAIPERLLREGFSFQFDSISKLMKSFSHKIEKPGRSLNPV